MGRTLSSMNLLFRSLLYLPMVLPDLTAVLYSLLSLNWNCTLAFSFKVGGFSSSDSWYERVSFSDNVLKAVFRDSVNVLLNGFFLMIFYGWIITTVFILLHDFLIWFQFWDNVAVVFVSYLTWLWRVLFCIEFQVIVSISSQW